MEQQRKETSLLAGIGPESTPSATFAVTVPAAPSNVIVTNPAI